MSDPPNTRLVEIPGAGHDVQLENVPASRGAVEGFLEAARP